MQDLVSKERRRKFRATSRDVQHLWEAIPADVR